MNSKKKKVTKPKTTMHKLNTEYEMLNMQIWTLDLKVIDADSMGSNVW